MIIDLNYDFKYLDGTKMVGPEKTEPDGEGGEETIPGEPLTLKMICEKVLTVQQPLRPGEKDIEVEEKLQRADVAMRIFKEKGKVDLTAEEIVLLKKLIGKNGGPLIVRQAFDVLDPKDKPPKKERPKIPSKKNT